MRVCLLLAGLAALPLWGAGSANSAPEVLKGHAGFVTSIAFSPDGRSLVSGGDDRTVRFWDVAANKAIHSVPTSEEIYAVAYSPDGRWVVSSGYNAELLLFDAHSGTRARRPSRD